MELFGSLERLMSDLYPYRYAIAATAIALLLAAAGVVWWRGWHRVALRHPKVTLITAVIALAIAVPLGNYLLSPLWTRTTLVEESPLAALASSRDMATATPESSSAMATPTASTATPTPSPTRELARPTATTAAEGAASVASATPAPANPTPPEATPPPPEPTATEVPPTPEPAPFEPHIVLAGEFYGADDFHFGRGTALIIQVEPGIYVLRFEDFSVRNGPDLRVYLSTNPDGYSANDYEIGPLRATDGSFNYDIPPDVDISIYRSVIIWCEPFAVLFATAPLFPAE